MAESKLKVNLAVDHKIEEVPYTATSTAEDVCIFLCRKLGIGTIARHLFALRIPGKQIFFMPSATFTEKIKECDLRIRFKVASIKKLKKIDSKAYDYYFHQARNDVLENKIPDLVYEKYQKELLGLGITDMYRVMLEKEILQETVENDYKKYIPKEVLKRHAFFIKKPIHNTLSQIKKSAHDAWYVKAEYLRQLDAMVSEYLAEEYKAVTEEDGIISSLIVRVSPFASEPGIKYCLESKKDKWHCICALEDLGFISLRNDGTVEISRRNGIPFYLKFNNMQNMLSFVSLVDGYYRLSVKWTFNICKDVITPSLLKLYLMKCHGPVGGEFSYAKLEEKRGNKPGCFILRESDSKYNIFYIDVCVKDSSKPQTYKLEYLSGDEFIFHNDVTRYKSIQQLMSVYNKEDGEIFLGECLPPSENEKSPLLLCQSDSLAGDSLIDSSTVENLHSHPRCINNKDLQVYKGTWCYTEDPEIPIDLCNVRDCDKIEECTILLSGEGVGRRVYILPQWKETGLHGGLRFSVKQWNPDLVTGLAFDLLPLTGFVSMRLEIGAESNEKMILYYDSKIVKEKTMSHIIGSGKWTSFWLQIRIGEIILGVEGVPNPLFEWTHPNTSDAMSPVYLVMSTLNGYPLGMSFQCDECHTEITNTKRWSKIYPIGLWSDEESHHKSLKFNVRGNGSILIPLYLMPNSDQYYSIGITDAGQKKTSSEGITIVYRGMWRHTKGKKIEVAMKTLKCDFREKYLNDFLDIAGQWAFLRSNAVVKLFGVTLSTQMSMILEYVKYGPLDQYLRTNKNRIKEVDLIEASSNLGSAIWHLEEHGIVHGKIRCRKLLVHHHDENTFSIKLSDPGISSGYAPSEVHWIPIECYNNANFAKHSTPADVWAFGTTLWEIFMFGEVIQKIDHHEAMRMYKSGKRLPKPNHCPKDIYQLMRECWDKDPHRRKQPQAIMRDINQLMYEVYNSRRVHSYAKINVSQSKSLSTSSYSLMSQETATTLVMDELLSMSDSNEITSNQPAASNLRNMRHGWQSQDDFSSEDTISCDFSNILSNFNLSTTTTSLDSINSIQSIFELDGEWNVVLQGKIGQGFYGDVYKATLERIGDKDYEPRQVAVKKLKKVPGLSHLQDFEREISIMKTLKHPNIVEILGVLNEPEVSLVMEFVQHGSFQSYLKINKEFLTERQLLKYALDIAMGMAYLGEKKIVHRDLAARNILVVDKNFVKISDFGLAQVMGADNYYIMKTNRDLPIKWYAPESLEEGKFSTMSDVWSYGVTLWEMFSYGEEPKLAVFEGKKIEGQEQQVLLKALQTGARYPCPPMCKQAIYASIIHPCWEYNPHDRPTFTSICQQITLQTKFD